jgi:hypothetical protein
VISQRGWQVSSKRKGPHSSLNVALIYSGNDRSILSKPAQSRIASEKYLDAVAGFLSGRYRILETCRGATCYTARLQKSDGDDWRTIANWATIWIALWSKKTVKESWNRRPFWLQKGKGQSDFSDWPVFNAGDDRSLS